MRENLLWSLTTAKKREPALVQLPVEMVFQSVNFVIP